MINNFITPANKKLYFRKIINDDKEPKDEDLIKKLNYNITVNEVSKNKNLEYIKKTHLKDYLSKDISPKLKCYPVDFNKKAIEEIIKNEKDNEIIMFILNNLTLGDYIDLFLYKKELKDFGKIDEDKINQIKRIFIGVDILFEKKDSLKNNKIYKLVSKFAELMNDKKYISKFFYIFYNYERFLFIKQSREKKDTRQKKDNEENQDNEE